MNKENTYIIVGGGCFWGMQELLRKAPFVLRTEVGYAGGNVPNPTYEKHDGYTEVVKLWYDGSEDALRKILDLFFRIHDPTTPNRQGNDTGFAYRSVIFYCDDVQKKVAQEFLQMVDASGRFARPVCTALEAYSTYTKAEEYHQDYLQKNPGGYTCHALRLDTFLTDEKR